MKDTPSISLPKWPFYLGDILLVANAFILLFRTDGELSTGAVVGCVASIFLGAVFFVLPYYIEYKDKVKEASKSNNKEVKDLTEQFESLLSRVTSLQQAQESTLTKLEREALTLESLLKLMEVRLMEESNNQEDKTLIHFEDEHIPDEEFEIDFDVDDEEDEEGEEVTSIVIAKIQMGIGSKPFIRGEGGGLSWDKGTPMEFLSVGNWRWKSEPTDTSIKFQIFKNDTVPQDSDPLTLEPGEKLEIHPSFSS